MSSAPAYHLLFYADWMSLPLLAAALVVATALVVLFYRMVYRLLPRPVLVLLVALRSLAILVLLLLIFKPVVSHTERIHRRARLAVLVDTSRSMSVRDYPNSPSRLEMAGAELRSRLDDLRRDFDLHLFSFDAVARPIKGDALPTEASGDATNLSRAVAGALDVTPHDDLAGVVLLTDGIHNGGGDPVATLATNPAAPIFPVGIGSDLSAASGFQDIGIVGLDAPEEATVNTRSEVTVRIDATGFADRAIDVELRDGQSDAVVSTQRLVLDGRPGPQAVRLQFTPERKGSLRYVVAVAADPAERIRDNNRQEFYVLGAEPRIHVLYIETLRPEYGPLKEVLETDPNIDVLSLVQIQKGSFLKGGNLRGVELAAFPRTRDEMKPFDVFIIGNLDASFLSRAQMEALRDLVRDDGKALLMIGGSDTLGSGGYGGSPLEEALPATLGARDVGQITQPFTMELTSEGLAHPIFAGTGEFFRYAGHAAEDNLPLLKGCNRLAEVKPGAAVLAVHPAERLAGRPAPVLLVQQFGEGRTAIFTGDTTYQWHRYFKVIGRESPYVKFWGQMVRYLADKDVEERTAEPGLAFALRKPQYLPGEAVVLQATVAEAEGRATNFASVRAEITGPDGKKRTESLPNVPASVGVYRTTFTPDDAGKHALRLVAEKDGQTLGEASAEFSVLRPNQEFERLSIDEKLMRDLASRTNGRYVRLTTFGDLLDGLRQALVVKDEYVEWPLLGLRVIPLPGGSAVTMTHVLFGLFLGLVTAEWLIRRRYLLQ